MIILKQPQLVLTEDGKQRLQCIVDFNGLEKTIWVEVDQMYAKYLCDERADAFVFLLLPYAMWHKCDIVCEAPVTEQLLYQITEQLIPVLSDHSDFLYHTKIIADQAGPIEKNGNAVGTGLSCGVDSFHAVYSAMNQQSEHLRLTHLLLFYSMVRNPKNDLIFEREIIRSTKVAAELGLPMIIADTNCTEYLPVNDWFNNYNTFSLVFMALCLQKLFAIYYCASVGHDFTAFDIKDSENTDCAVYDLLTLDSASFPGMKFYSEGGAKKRYEKVKDIIGFPIAQNNLHVCNDREDNCSVCGKCSRTLTILEALDSLEKFRNVFDIQRYYDHHDEYMRWLYIRNTCGDDFISEAYQALKNDPEIIRMENDPVWSSLHAAKGIYEDGWVSSRLRATLMSPGGRIGLSLYVPTLTAKNHISVSIDGIEKYAVDLPEGIHDISIEVEKDKQLALEVIPSVVVNPAKDGLSDDVRDLSFILKAVSC